MKKVGKVLVIILAVILVLVGCGIAVSYWFVTQKVGKVQTVDIDENQIEITEGVQEQLTGYRNIVFLGIDTREDGYALGNRSDCIIIATLDQANKEVKLTSVYRDTYLEIPGKGLDKVTHAYAYEGPTLTMSTLNTNLDLDIKEFVTVNFDAVAEAVNSLGGVTMDITKEEVKYINAYIDGTSADTGISSKHITQSGTYLLDGVQAVAYGRIRYTEGWDYKRTERMRTVLMKMFEKAKGKSITELNKFIDDILPKIQTNIDKKEMLALLPEIASYKVVNNIGWPYRTEGATINRVWYGPPITLESNVRQLHQEVFREENYEPSETVKRISNEIIKKTGYQ